jgi:hypothetical protein
MWKSIAVILLAVVVTRSADAQESPALAGWHKFESAEGRFVAYFPGPPSYAPDTRSQFKLPHRWVYTAKDGSTYIAGYTDGLAGQVAKVGPKDALHEVTYLLSLDNAHMAGRLFTYSGYPAQQNKVRTPDWKFYRSRYLFIGNRLYFWAFIGSLETVDGENADSMLSSFVLPK